MTTAYVLVTLVAAAANAYAAAVDVVQPGWVVANMSRLGIPLRRLPALGAPKALGALGLVVGLAAPAVGVAAAAGLVVFFTGAVATVVRVGWYGHLPYPAAWLALSAAALALRLATYP